MMSDTAQQDLRARLSGLGASTLHESVASNGRRGAMASDVRPLAAEFKVAGLAATVSCRPADNLAIHRALDVAEAGSVLVVATGGYLAGYWGEILTARACSRGVLGLVIDGAVRDVEAIVERGFPVFSRGVSMFGTSKTDPGHLGETVVCGDVPVSAGDWVVGDRDGVVVLPGEEIEDIVERAEQRAERERSVLAQLDRTRNP